MPFPDDPDDDAGFVPPLHPDDRLWRHPSEMAASRRVVAPTADPERVATVGVPRVWTVAAASVLLGVAVTLAVLSVTGTFDNGTVQTVVEQVEAPASDATTGAAAVTARVDAAIVRVDAVRANGTVTATGTVYRSDGHVLTTADAVGGATSLTVTTSDGSVLVATLVGLDTATDIAVLDVDRNDMTTAVMARVADVAAGEDALAVEREPDAVGPAVVTGHVSALGLRIDTTDGASLHDMIQASLETAPEAGGAVLCRDDGAVLGLLTSRTLAGAPHYTQTSLETSGTTSTTTSTGMATIYATPIDYAAQVADDIIETGTARHTWLGVLGDDLDPTAAAFLGRSAATLTRVVADGPAAAAGLEEGDVVLSLDGVQTTSMSSLVVALRTHRPGDQVAVTFIRDSAQRATLVTLTTGA
jgi:putative serine protease PepD